MQHDSILKETTLLSSFPLLPKTWHLSPRIESPRTTSHRRTAYRLLINRFLFEVKFFSSAFNL